MKLLAPFSGMYGAAVSLRNRWYKDGTLHSRKLQWPVVSVGNLRVGGSGKTPFVVHLGELLQAAQFPFTVLSRGYGRARGGVHLVDESGSARDFGDEPLLMARKLGVPVVVGADRFAAGEFAEKQFAHLAPAHGKHWLHVLDDGFQHRALARDFDIVLLTPEDAHDVLLPAGRLREPLSALQRADAIVLPAGADPSSFPLKGKPVWWVERGLDIGGQPLPPRVIVFSGIARPERFAADLRTIGIEVVAEKRYRDHYRYLPSDADALKRLSQQHGIPLATTEKDEMNLRAAGLWETLGPVRAFAVRLRLQEPQAALSTMLGVIAERKTC
jgi:tetraacyldisaccharide 4'-kinase